MLALEKKIRLEVDHTVFDLKEAEYASFITFSYFIRNVSQFCYCKFTKRSFVISAEVIIDTALFCCVLLWIERDRYYHTHHTSHVFAADDADSSNSNFILNIIEANETGSFHFDYLLAFVATTFWARLFYMLQLTRQIGPLIKIIQAMIYDLTSFLVIYGISLMGFTSLGMMLFSELDEFTNFFDSFFYTFSVSNGEWDETIFHKLSRNYQIGYAWLFGTIIINLLVIVTLLISIFSDTYVKFS